MEAYFLPIRSNQSISKESIVRSKDRLCWTWVSDKERLAESDNIDVFLDTPKGDRSYPEIIDQATKLPWHRRGALPIGHYERNYCIALPSYVGPDAEVRLNQRIHYRGIGGLWTVLVNLPEVVSPGSAP